jgi:hypothetical protein
VEVRRVKSLAFAVAVSVVGCGGRLGADAVADAAAGGDGALGSPCTQDYDCAGSLCLGGPFAGGYCSATVVECDPGNVSEYCADAGACRKTGATDIDGGAIGEFCLAWCSTSSDCRAGYSCCPAEEYGNLADASVCAPTSLCPNH